MEPGVGGGEGSERVMGTKYPFRMLRKSWRLDRGGSAMCLCLMPLSCALKNGYNSKFNVIISP